MVGLLGSVWAGVGEVFREGGAFMYIALLVVVVVLVRWSKGKGPRE